LGGDLLKVAWLASAIVGREASGTAQTAKKIIFYCGVKFKNEIEVTLLVKNKLEHKMVLEDPALTDCKVEVLPTVYGKKFIGSRQFYKYCFKNKSKKYDILHFSVPRVYPFFWKFPAKKFVCTFHAAGDITVPVDKFVLSRNIYNHIMKRQWQHLSAIYADSNFAVKEIATNYKIPSTKITKIFLGADTLWNIESKNLIMDDSKVNIVIVGRWQKYKNVHTIVTAIKQCDNPMIKKAQLWLIGKSNSSGRNLVLNALKDIAHKQIKIFDYISDPEIKYLYNHVNLTIHPSINEGFGLPAFEAFGEGSALLIHKGTPASEYLKEFKEVASANLLEHKEIINAINSLLVNQVKQDLSIKREFLSSMGMTWERMVNTYYESYKKITT
jgi:glycosyltransferase involved in cell wall biosynthesis